MLPEVTDFCRLVLLRHPELHPRHEHIAVGAGAAELSRRGKQRALDWQGLLAAESVDSVVAADQPQAILPAEALARPRGLEVGGEPRWRDQSLGRWEGRAWGELAQAEPQRVREFFEHFAEAVPPDGESLGQATERALAWWHEAAPASAGKTVAVVAAGSVLAGFAAAMLGMRLSRSLSLQLPHGGVGVLDVYANGARLSAWNVDALARG